MRIEETFGSVKKLGKRQFDFKKLSIVQMFPVLYYLYVSGINEAL